MADINIMMWTSQPMKKNIDNEWKKKKTPRKAAGSHGKSELYPFVISPENSLSVKYYLTK